MAGTAIQREIARCVIWVHRVVVVGTMAINAIHTRRIEAACVARLTRQRCVCPGEREFAMIVACWFPRRLFHSVALFALERKLQSEVINGLRQFVFLSMTCGTLKRKGCKLALLLVRVAVPAIDHSMRTKQWKSCRLVENDKLSRSSPTLRTVTILTCQAKLRTMFILMTSGTSIGKSVNPLSMMACVALHVLMFTIKREFRQRMIERNILLYRLPCPCCVALLACDAIRVVRYAIRLLRVTPVETKETHQ